MKRSTFSSWQTSALSSMIGYDFAFSKRERIIQRKDRKEKERTGKKTKTKKKKRKNRRKELKQREKEKWKGIKEEGMRNTTQ